MMSPPGAVVPGSRVDFDAIGTDILDVGLGLLSFWGVGCDHMVWGLKGVL